MQPTFLVVKKLVGVINLKFVLLSTHQWVVKFMSVKRGPYVTAMYEEK